MGGWRDAARDVLERLAAGSIAEDTSLLESIVVVRLSQPTTTLFNCFTSSCFLVVAHPELLPSRRPSDLFSRPSNASSRGVAFGSVHRREHYPHHNKRAPRPLDLPLCLLLSQHRASLAAIVTQPLFRLKRLHPQYVLLRNSPVEDRAAGSCLAVRQFGAQAVKEPHLASQRQGQC